MTHFTNNNKHECENNKTYVQPKFSGSIIVNIQSGMCDYKSGDILWEEKGKETIQWCDKMNGLYIKRLNKIVKYDNDKGLYLDTCTIYDNGMLVFVPPECGVGIKQTFYVGRLFR
jgi:hypothetical protein